ncbi:MAG: tetratricopeptide repeat protein [Mariprofundaceae bacterium]
MKYLYFPPALMLAFLSLVFLATGAANAVPPNPEPAASIHEQGMKLAGEGKPVQAAKVFLDAAEQGNRHSQYQLGLLYARGEGVEQDFSLAHKWLHKAAMQGHPKAQYYLGQMYVNGDGVAEDHVEATVWFWLAASLGDRFAITRWRIIMTRITKQDMIEVNKRSNDLWKKIPHDMKKKSSLMH